MNHTRSFTFDLSAAIKRNPKIGVDRVAAALCGMLLLDKTRSGTALVVFEFDGSLRLLSTDDTEALYSDALPIWGNRTMRDALLDPRTKGQNSKLRSTLTRKPKGPDNAGALFKQKIEAVLAVIGDNRMFLHDEFIKDYTVDRRLVCRQLALDPIDANLENTRLRRRSERCSAIASEALALSASCIYGKTPSDEMRLVARATLAALRMQELESRHGTPPK